MLRPPTPRAKPSKRKPIQRRAQATREAVVQAAAQLLGRHGYAQLTTNHVAERAGVSIGSVYEYFRNKEALVQAVLDTHLSAGEALLSRRAAELGQGALRRPLRALVEGWVDTMLELHADNPKLHRVLSSEVPRTRAIEARVAALEAQAVAAVSALLSAHPEAKVSSVELAARLVVDAVEALTHRWALDEAGQPVPKERLRAELVHMLTAYLEKR